MRNGADGLIGPSADVVVVGGGVLGCSAAYHLARTGGLRVALLERGAVGGGASSRAAGLMTRLRPSAEQIDAVRRTYDLVADLEESGAEGPLITVHGSLHIAREPRARASLGALISLGASHGIAAETMAPADAVALCPWLSLDEPALVVHTPGDGVSDGALLAAALARAARRSGATIHQGVEARSLIVDRGAIAAVETSAGTIWCPAVVDAAGAWAGSVGWNAGAAWPQAPVRSGYWITDAALGYPTDMPFAILTDAAAYCAPDQGGLVIGLRERLCVAIDPRTLPADTSELQELGRTEGWRILTEGAVTLVAFLPRLADMPMRRFIAGFSTYTPDGSFLVGEHPTLAGLYVASGCNGAGVAAAGGIGGAIADVVLERPTAFETAPFDPSRFGNVDPFGPQFLDRCAAARAAKRSG